MTELHASHLRLPPSQRAVTRVEPSGGMLRQFGELWRYRDLLWTLAGRDLKLRYKQTILGAGWGVLQPLIAAAIFAFLFGRVGNFASGGLPYLPFAFAGMVGWTLFGQNLDKIASSLVTNASLVAKVYFPRLLLPLAPVLCGLVDALVALAVMGVMLLYYGIVPAWNGAGIVLVPLWLLMLAGVAAGVGILLSALAAHYRDVRFATPVMVQMLFFISPVAYSAEQVRERVPRWAAVVYDLNPLAAPLQGLRWSLLGAAPPSISSVAISAVMTLFLLVVGVLVFGRMERRFADVI